MAAERRRIHVVGRKNSGKTTLICDLVRHLRSRGCRVGTIKHTHHHHELDTPGKDSFQHRQAGANVVGIVSPGMNAAFLPQDQVSPTDPYRSLAALFADCDLVLVEGHSATTAPKIEVWRAAAGCAPIAAEDGTVVAVISDDAVPADVPVWSRSDIAGLARRVLELAGK